jgi:hypothetical protein
MALLEEGRPLRKCYLKAMLVMCWHRDIEIEDWEFEEIMDGA